MQFFGYGRRTFARAVYSGFKRTRCPGLTMLLCMYISIVRGNKAKVKGKTGKISVKFLMRRTRARSSTQYPTCNPSTSTFCNFTILGLAVSGELNGDAEMYVIKNPHQFRVTSLSGLKRSSVSFQLEVYARCDVNES